MLLGACAYLATEESPPGFALALRVKLFRFARCQCEHYGIDDNLGWAFLLPFEQSEHGARRYNRPVDSR